MKIFLIPTRLGRRIIIVTLSTRRQVNYNWKNWCPWQEYDFMEFRFAISLEVLSLILARGRLQRQLLKSFKGKGSARPITWRTRSKRSSALSSAVLAPNMFFCFIDMYNPSFHAWREVNELLTQYLYSFFLIDCWIWEVGKYCPIDSGDQLVKRWKVMNT